MSLNVIARAAERDPAPRVTLVRSRTVAKVDSIGFVVRRWIQCSAGLPLPGDLVDPLVVHPRRFDRHRPGGCGDVALPVIAVTHHQAPTGLVADVGQLGGVGVDLGLQGRRKHPPGAFAHDLVDQGAVVDRAVGVRAYPPE